MKLTLGQKVGRVIKLLLGIRKRRIAGPLVAHGFTQEDLEQGWTLLRGVSATRIDAVPYKSPPRPNALAELDTFENFWFPIARATLQFRFPAVYERLFLNLGQAEGPAVIISVVTFIDRFVNLDKNEAGESDPKGADAKALLEKRGLKPEVIAKAQGLIEELGTIEKATLLDIEDEAARLVEAEDKLWAWYLEWSTIARKAITDRRLLKSLGFLRSAGAKAEEEELEIEEQGETEEIEGPVGTA